MPQLPAVFAEVALQAKTLLTKLSLLFEDGTEVPHDPQLGRRC